MANSIVKNTVFLYVRMLLITCVTLYTSRVVLDQLGVSDFGVYSLVGGIIAMLGFLNASMATATQRYLSYDIGRGDFTQLKKTFGTSLTIHFILAFFALLLAETVGLWYINNRMVFPIERTVAVNIVYQFSVLTFLLGMIQVPYNSLILARERMNVYAYVSIAEAVLKLLIVYCLVVVKSDKLVLYSILVFLVSFTIRLIYQIYCRKNFEESRYEFFFDKRYFFEILAYSGWNLFGNIAAILRLQGSNVLLNLFFGTLINAAYGITIQVQGAANMLVSNFQMALNPQIVQSYAAKNLKRATYLVTQGCKLSFFLMLIVVFPVLYNTEHILGIWLKQVPDYTVSFVQLSLIYILIDSLSSPIAVLLQATGSIKWYQLTVGGLNLFVLPVSFLFLSEGSPPVVVLYVALLFCVCSLVLRVYFAVSQVKFDIGRFLYEVIIPIILVTIFSILSLDQFISFSSGGMSVFLSAAFSCLIVIVGIFFIGLSKDERQTVYSIIARRVFNGKLEK